ncbi:hypothetical protein SRHO_G00140470 [Serrasalmus rhombeus]
MSINYPGDSGMKKLSELLKEKKCKLQKLQLKWCGITDEGCADLFKALKSNHSSQLKELNLTQNKPGDSAVKLLSGLLKDPDCKLEKLELKRCRITEEGCAALFEALKENSSSQLRELNLNHNKPGDSVVNQLSDLLKVENCKLEKIELSDCRITEEGYAAVASALKLNPSSQLRELNLSRNKPGELGVEQLFDLLKDPCCKLKKLQI